MKVTLSLLPKLAKITLKDFLYASVSHLAKSWHHVSSTFPSCGRRARGCRRRMFGSVGVHAPGSSWAWWGSGLMSYPLGSMAYLHLSICGFPFCSAFSLLLGAPNVIWLSRCLVIFHVPIAPVMFTRTQISVGLKGQAEWCVHSHEVKMKS